MVLLIRGRTSARGVSSLEQPASACAMRTLQKYYCTVTPRMRGDVKKAVSSGLLTNYWEQADWTPAGFEEPLQRLRSLIERTQQPAQCSSLCRMAPNTHVGGAASNLKRLAFHLALASLEGCALVGRYPPALFPAGLMTGELLRERCTASSRFGIECYFVPVSTCPVPKGTWVRIIRVNRTRTHSVLDHVATSTGLRSELLTMGTLHAWIMRPQPELLEAIRFYGAQLGLLAFGTRQRHIGMHIRHGDKTSLSDKNKNRNLGRDVFRVSAASFQAWGRRVGANMGAERVLFMSDDPRVINAMQGSYEQYFVTPTPPNCTPSFAMGMGGGRAAGKFRSLILSQIQVQREYEARGGGRTVSARLTNDAGSHDEALECGPAYLQDDGIQLFASMMLLAQCAALIGTQISNVDAVIAELMATVHHPPVVIDVLNDLNQPAESDERVWHLGMHQARARPLPLERLVDTRGGVAAQPQHSNDSM